MTIYKYRAMNSLGDWFLFENKPTQTDMGWSRSGSWVKIENPTFLTHAISWEFSLCYCKDGFNPDGTKRVCAETVEQPILQSLEYVEPSSQSSCVDELFNLIGDKNVSVSFDCVGQDKTITIVDSDGKTYLATNVEELKEILSAIDTLTKYYYAQ